MPASNPFPQRGLQIVADDKIRAAINRGEFDQLPGLGEPHALIDEPYDPHWWLRRKLQREQLQTKIKSTFADYYS